MENDTKTEKSKYNSFGVCLDCNGGKDYCLHNNMSEVEGKIVCSTCGIIIK